MSVLETVIQFAKIGFGVYFVYWSYKVLIVLNSIFYAIKHL